MAAQAQTAAVAVKPSAIVMKMQGAWGAKDIFNEMAEDYVKRVNEMSGGALHIDYLTAGAVVKPFEVTDAVSKGVRDAGHTVAVYWYGKSKVASLFGSGPITGANAEQTLGWMMRGGGYAYYEELQKQLGLNLKGFLAFPMPTQPLGWFKKTPPKTAAELKAILQYAAEATSSANTWTAQDNYSKDLQTRITKDKVQVSRTPKAVFDAQIKARDTVTARLEAEDPFFKKVLASQKDWARRVAYYSFFNDADYKSAFEHVFKTKLPS